MSAVTAIEVRQKAAELIEAKGWGQGSPPRSTGICLVDAIDEAAFGGQFPVGSRFEASIQALSDLCEELGAVNLVNWNDSPDRTKAEVLAALRGQS